MKNAGFLTSSSFGTAWRPEFMPAHVSRIAYNHHAIMKWGRRGVAACSDAATPGSRKCGTLLKTNS